MAAVQVHVSQAAWGVIFAAATLVIVVFGFPLLLRGGGRLGGRRGRRRDYRIRYGPSLPVVLAVALVRRLDQIVLVLAMIAFVVLIVVNART